MKNIISIILISTMLILSGCAINFDPMSIIKNNPQVQSFLEEYPNAEVLVTYYGLNESVQLISEIEENCDKIIEPKEMYRFYVEDEESDLEIIGYLDATSQRVECIKKYAPDQIYEEEIEKDVKEDLSEEKEEEHKKDEYYENENKYDEDSSDKKIEGVYVEVEAEFEDGVVYLEWEVEGIENVKYHKVLKSYLVEHPKYPEDDAILVLEQSEYGTQYSFEKEFYEKNENIVYYSVDVVLLNDEVVHGNPVKVHVEDEKEYYEKPKVEIEGEYEFEDNLLEIEIELEGSLEEIEYLKVIRSYENENLNYPESELVKTIEKPREDDYEFEILEDEIGPFYYGAVLITYEGEETYSNVLDFEAEIEEEEEEEKEEITEEDIEIEDKESNNNQTNSTS